MSNSWIEHIKEVAKRDNVPYPVALVRAKESYKKKEQLPATPKTSPRKKGKTAPGVEVPAVDVPPVKVGKKNLK
jgi:hypothetical protein